MPRNATHTPHRTHRTALRSTHKDVYTNKTSHNYPRHLGCRIKQGVQRASPHGPPSASLTYACTIGDHDCAKRGATCEQCRSIARVRTALAPCRATATSWGIDLHNAPFAPSPIVNIVMLAHPPQVAEPSTPAHRTLPLYWAMATRGPGSGLRARECSKAFSRRGGRSDVREAVIRGGRREAVVKGR